MSTILVIAKSNSRKKLSNNNVVATITYSKYDGIDAGEEHIYELYYKNNKNYRYDYKQYQITIAGQEEKKSKNGTIKNKKDLSKISKKYSNYDLNIIYYDNNENINFSTIEELSKKLF